MTVVRDWARNGFAAMPDPNGWMHIMFPFPALKLRLEGTIDLFREAQLLCPPCGVEVAKFIAHRRAPMIDDEDLIG